MLNFEVDDHGVAYCLDFIQMSDKVLDIVTVAKSKLYSNDIHVWACNVL